MRISSIFCLFLVLIVVKVYGQDSLQFLAYGNIPTWVAVATDWEKNPTIHIYDSERYKGHAEFVNRGLGRKITFPEFKSLARTHSKRQFLPFFIYDIRNNPLTINDKKYTWAIRLEDYQYDDSPEELTQAIKKLHHLIREQMPFLSTQGLIILTSGGTNNFNIAKIGNLIKQNEMNYISLQTLMNHCKSSKTAVLNEMPAWGKLIQLKDEKELSLVGINDIIVLDFIPEKLPPVAGIITLVPQTPLSHVNLLAKNRGTLNLYAEGLAELPQVKANMDKWVKISFSPAKQMIVTATTAKVAIAENEKRKPSPLIIPKAKTDMQSLIPLDEAFKQYAKPEYIGAKAANYAFLYTFLSHTYIRPAFALGFSPYKKVISQGADKLIQELNKEKKHFSIEEIQNALKEIRKEIKTADFDKEVLNSLGKQIEQTYPNHRIRLRSSTNCEDLPGFNGAGLYLSQGFNTDEADSVLVKKILKVYASLWTWEAFQEREYYGIDHREAAMAILIHEAFSDELANGVVLTQPLKNGEISILVNVQSGDEAIVSPDADVIPEAFFLDVKKGTVEKVVSRSNIKPIFVNNDEYSSLLPLLKEQTLLIHQAFIERQKAIGDTHNYGVDIEFKIEKNGGLYIKQARLLSEVLPE